MRAGLDRYAQRLWYGDRPPAWGWRALAAIYRWSLGRRWRRPSERPALPVIVVGNLSAGGTGKTPVVMALVRHLQAAGLQLAIISRGYGGRVGRGPVRVARDADPAQVGDEPALMAASLDVPVWVATRRRLALEAARADGAMLVISDDGLQHRDLPRSYEIVVVDGMRGFGNGQLLPAGPLRCPPERLAEVDAVLLRGPCHAAGLPSGLVFELQPVLLRRLADGVRLAADSLRGQMVSAVCGIGHPEQFAAQLQRLGMQVKLHPFPDHHAYVPADLDGLARPIITTAKDAIKLARLAPLPDGVLVLEVAAALPSGLLEAVIGHVRKFKT